MSCWTIYIVRELDGSLRWCGDKYAPLEHESPEALAATIADFVDPPLARPGFFVPAWCRGWYVDRAARLARMFTCNRKELADHDRALARWIDWDARIAYEGRFEIAERIGEPTGGDDHAGWLDTWRGAADAGLVTAGDFIHRWDPIRRELHHDWYWHDGVDLSVIDHDGFVMHYGFTDQRALFAGLGHGHVLLDELATRAPCPEVVATLGGAVIDCRTCTIHVWHPDPIAPSTYRTLHERWPGWRIERETGGADGHLERVAGLRTITTIVDAS